MQSVDREARPERAGVDRAEQQVALLVVDGERQVDHLDVVVRADIADRIGRVHAETKDVEVILVAEPFEVGQRSRDGGGRRSRRKSGRHRALQRAIAGIALVGDDRPTIRTNIDRLVIGVAADRRPGDARRKVVVARARCRTPRRS